MAFEQKTFQITLSEHALWMPVYTQPRHEFRLHDYLKERGIPVYLPVVPDIKIHRVHKGASQYTYRKTVLRPMFQSYHRNYGLEVHIARFHNIFGPLGTWCGGREKAPAAMCRKVAEAANGGEIEIWGDGEQTRSFLYVDECVEAIRRLVNSDFMGPVNIGSEEMISINNLALMAAEIAGKKITLKHIEGPLGVRGRNSENTLIREKLGWAPSRPLREGMEKTYRWIAEQVKAAAK